VISTRLLSQGEIHMKELLAKIALWFLATFSLIAIGVSCRSNSTPVAYAIVSEGNVNTNITLSTPKEWNTFLINAEVCFWVELISEYPVIIKDDAVEVSELVNNDWKVVEFEEDTSPTTYILYPNDNAALRGAAICVHPIFGDRTNPVKLRIIILGNLYIDEVMGDRTMAFCDLVLYP
jgi:hypothetical protein